MQTIIQHVVRGNGVPAITPVEIGIHYIDVQTGDLYISRGKTNVSDWGEPLKAAMIEGDEGKTFGWNNGQEWIVLNIGVQPEAVDQLDGNNATTTSRYTDESVEAIGLLGTSIETIARDGVIESDVRGYVDSQLTLVSGVPGGGDALTVLAKLSDADRDVYWLTVFQGEVLQQTLNASIDGIHADVTSAIDSTHQVPMDGHRNDVVTVEGWVESSVAVSQPRILYPGAGDQVSCVLRIEGSEYDSVYHGAPRLHREFVVNGELTAVDADGITLSLVPNTQYTLKCRDVTLIGVSRWSEVTFSTLAITVNLTLDVERSVGSLISSNPKLTAGVTTTGTIDSFTKIEWSVEDNSGVIVWTATDAFVSGTAQTTVPNGLLEVGESYTFKARVHHDLHGWVAQRSVTGTIAESVTQYLAFSSQQSYVYGQNVDSFDSTGITYQSPGRSAVTTISSTGEYLAVGLSSSPYLVVYQRQGTTFTQIATGIVLTSEVRSIAFNSTDTSIAIGSIQAPYIDVYTINAGVFTKLPTPSILPAGTVNACAYSPDDQHLALSSYNHPVLMIYKQTGGTLQKLSLTVTNGLSIAYGCSYNNTGTLLAVATAYDPFLVAYKRSGDAYTQLTNPDVLPSGTVNGGCFSSDGTYQVVVNQSSPYVHFYKYRNHNMYNMLPSPATLPTGSGNDCAFSSDNNYLAVAHNTSPYITIYKRSGDTFTKLANPSQQPPGSARGCSFNGTTHLAVSHDSSPYITIYKRSGDTFTKLANPSSLPSGTGYACRFSKGSSHLAVAHASSPYITIYSYSGDTFTKLANPGTLPTGIGYGCSFDSTGNYLAVAHATSPYVTVYSRSGDVFNKLANPSTLPPATCAGVCFDSNFLALSSSGGNYRAVYSLNTSTNTLTSLHASTPTLSSASSGVWCSPGFWTLCFGQTAVNGAIRMMRRVSSSFSALVYPGEQPNATANGCHFNPITNDLVTVSTGTTGQIKIYSNVGTNLTRVVTQNTNGDAVGCRFSPDGRYLVVMMKSSPYVRVYKWESPQMTALPALSPAVTTPISTNTEPSWYYITG